MQPALHRTLLGRKPRSPARFSLRLQTTDNRQMKPRPSRLVCHCAGTSDVIGELLELIHNHKMSRSGVAVSDEALQAFNDLKLGKKYRYVIYKLNDAKTQIIVDKTSSDDSYDAFLEEFPENDCKYAIYDFEYEISAGEGKRSKIVFYQWSPDTASIRAKMVYASSKDALRRALNGVSSDIQGTDFSEVSYEAVLEKVSRGAGSH